MKSMDTPATVSNTKEKGDLQKSDEEVACDRCGRPMFRMRAVYWCDHCGYKTDCCGH